MSNYTTQLRRGWSEIYAVTIEGIPYVFVERLAARVDSTSSVGIPAGYTSAVDALVIEGDQSVSIKIDRLSGGSSGSAWDLTLDYDSLNDAGALAGTFKAPPLRATLTQDLAYNDTTITVDDTTGFPASGSVYLGRELVTYTGTTGTTFTGCTRGVVGHPYKYSATSPTYRVVTDTPLIWRGRQVTIYAHLVSPEGRVLDSQWTTGTYSREIWRGSIDSVPQPIGRGFRLRCMPLARALAGQVGFDTTGELYSADTQDEISLSKFPVGDAKQSVFYHFEQGSTEEDVEIDAFGIAGESIYFLGTWAQKAASELSTELSSISVSSPKGAVVIAGGKAVVEISIVDLATNQSMSGSHALVPQSDGPYFLEPGVYTPTINGRNVRFRFPLRFTYGPGSWIPIGAVEGGGWMDQTIPAAGFGIVEAQGGAELISWDEKIDNTGSAQSDLQSTVMLRLKKRGINGTPHAGPVLDLIGGGSFRVAAGVSGTVLDVIKTVLESSGTGVRGSFDTLSLGFGYGIHEDQIDTSAGSLGSYQGLSSNSITAVSAGRASLEDLIGGYLVVNSVAITQRRSDDGVRLGLVETMPPSVADQSMTALDSDELLLGKVSPADLVDSPNVVTIDTSGINERPGITVQDIPRIQAEGLRDLSISCPGVSVPQAALYAQGVIALGNGLQSVRISVGAWVELEPGDPVNLQLSHPAIYDFADASRAPASVAGRVLENRFKLADGTQDLTILINGGFGGPQFLCPSAVIASKDSSTEVTLGAGQSAFYAEAERVTIYNVGQESAATPEIAVYTIDSINGSQVTFTTSIASWVGAGSIMTYCALSLASSRQANFAYYDSGTALV